MNKYPDQWQQLYTAWERKRVAQGLLFVGPLHCDLAGFTLQFAKLLICSSSTKHPCETCADCRMLERLEHPDLEWIKPEKPTSAIKIDQIRQLQSTVYLTPQRARYRLIIIEAADKMNTASANALLKILEEPAEHTVFVLLAQQLSTIVPTVLSRCQLVRFAGTDKSYPDNLLNFGDYYAKDSQRALMIKESESILNELIAVLEHEQHPCVLASKWAKFDMTTFLWFLYLVLAQLQHMHFTGSKPEGMAAVQLQKLSSKMQPLLVFALLDQVNCLLKKLNHNIAINQALVLENLLFALISN